MTGTVVNAATGEPLRRVLVTLNGQNTGFTDAAGTFSIDNVPDGQYFAQCQKPGFFAPNQQAGQWRPDSQITVSAATQPVTLKLVPAASLSGRVVDAQEQPVENAPIQMTSNMIVNGRRRWVLSNSASTDEDGNYEIDNVQPGTYRLRLKMHIASPFAAGANGNQIQLPVDVYPAQYYPQAPDASAAQPITLAPGQTEHADFTASATPGFRVRGTVSPANMGTFIRVEDSDGEDTGVGVNVNRRTGEWAVPALPPGTWTIIGVSSAQQEQLAGEETISVGGSDIANVRVQLLPATTIPVQISNQTGGNASNVQLRLIGDSGWGQREYQGTYSPMPEGANSAGKTGALSFRDVRAGHYDLWAQVFGAGCLDSVRYAGAQVGREGLTVTPNETASPLEATLREDCGTIHVNLNGAAGSKPVSVLLLSDNPVLDLKVMIATGGAPIDFSNLSPGNYRLYAFDDLSNLEYANPEAMRSFTAKEVTIEPKQTVDVTLDVTERTDRSTSYGAP